MMVVVGSSNPAKIYAVKDAFNEVFNEEITVEGLDMDSGVSNQPFGEETLSGALNRAKRALTIVEADYGVGIEGGLIQLGQRWYNLGFVAIINRAGVIGTGTSGWFECPKLILDELSKGRELGDVMDEISGQKESKRGVGAIGILTNRLVTRREFYKHGIFMALIPFLNKKLWSTDES